MNIIIQCIIKYTFQRVDLFSCCKIEKNAIYTLFISNVADYLNFPWTLLKNILVFHTTMEPLFRIHENFGSAPNGLDFGNFRTQ